MSDRLRALDLDTREQLPVPWIVVHRTPTGGIDWPRTNAPWNNMTPWRVVEVLEDESGAPAIALCVPRRKKRVRLGDSENGLTSLEWDNL